MWPRTRRHANVVPVMAKGVAELRTALAHQERLAELPEIHQFLDGFYLSRIGIRILIGEGRPGPAGWEGRPVGHARGPCMFACLHVRTPA